MKRIETLKKNYEFKNVIVNGKYYVRKQIIVYINSNKKEKNLIGIAINTKIGNAVERNFLKRKIRENYRTISQKLKTGYDIVIMWNKKTKPVDADYNEIKKEMTEIFEEAEILTK